MWHTGVCAFEIGDHTYVWRKELSNSGSEHALKSCARSKIGIFVRDASTENQLIPMVPASDADPLFWRDAADDMHVARTDSFFRLRPPRSRTKYDSGVPFPHFVGLVERSKCSASLKKVILKFPNFYITAYCNARFLSTQQLHHRCVGSAATFRGFNLPRHRFVVGMLSRSKIGIVSRRLR